MIKSRISRVLAVALAVTFMGCGGADLAAPVQGERGGVVYGVDNRTEFVNVTDARQRLAGQGTAALLSPSVINCTGATCAVTTVPFSRTTAFNTTTGKEVNNVPLCQSVRFRGQGVAASCTAFLVGPDTMMTAGHCLFDRNTPPKCSDARIVFTFNASSAGVAPATVNARDVYTCAGTPLGVNTDSEDWAVFKLDRSVTGRTPLIPQYSGALPHDELVVYGYPDGLPLKVAPQGFVHQDLAGDPVHFLSSVDIFPGNSGGPSIDAMTGIPVGITTNSPVNYLFTSDGQGGNCAAVNTCTESGVGQGGCSGFVLHTRVTWATQHGKVPLHTALLSAISAALI